MPKVSLQSQDLKSKQIWKHKDVTSVCVSNMSLVATSFIFKGVVRHLPAIDTNGVPVKPFEISDNGNHFDIELNFNQENVNVIIDYAHIINQENC